MAHEFHDGEQGDGAEEVHEHSGQAEVALIDRG